MNDIIQNKAKENTAVTDKKKAPQSISDYVKIMEPAIKKALPSTITAERFTRIVLSAVNGNETLAKCEINSFLGAMMTAAQLGLEPNTPLGHAYLIPYGGKCQFQLGYKGLIDLAHRSGEISSIQAHTVYENDTFEYEYGLEPKLVHKPAASDRGDPIYFYAIYKTKSDGFGFEVMSVDDARKHGRKYSKTYDKGPWLTNFEEMALKTALKKVLKYAPLKSDFVRAVSADESVKSVSAEEFNEKTDMTELPNEYFENTEYEDIGGRPDQTTPEQEGK